MKNKNVKFSLICKQKIIRHNFLSYRGPYTAVFVGDFVSHAPQRGLRPQALDEKQSIETEVNWFSRITG